MSTDRACPRCGAGLVQRYRDGKRSGWYCRPCANSRIKEYRVQEPDRYLDTKLWTHYRIRLADWRQMLKQQGNRCAACGVSVSDLKVLLPVESLGVDGNGLLIDHDHGCCPTPRTKGNRRSICGNCIRGLICHGCNVAAGMMREDPGRLENLAQYLRKWKAL